jgi:rSAM/selenodomain-associated transferase 2
MKIAVIIPTLNEAKRIGKTIRYIKENGGDAVYQLIVVDGGSSDHTVEIAMETGAVVIVSPNEGRGYQMHLGAQYSSDDIDIFYFVHADTLPPKMFVVEIESAVSQGAQIGTFPYQFDSKKPLLRLNAFCTKFRWFFTLGGDRSLFVLKEDYFKIGGYEQACVIMEDYDFLKRAKKAGYHLCMLQNPCIVSARKYEENSWLLVQLANFVTYHLWARGLMQPKKLRSLYWKILSR